MSAPPPPGDFLPLHPLTFRVLMSVTEGPSFGTEIVQRIETAEAGRKLYPANLYRRIRDLLEDGLLEECEGPADADPRRTYVRLTRLGRRVARAEARRLDALVADARSVDLLDA
ncbi:MAG: helix-turn-helix transcriptional regulator [Longimicrobiales bacterium]|nr:helix-turn-helix transcriptional regulator [Longimicrobiales bacterium]